MIYIKDLRKDIGVRNLFSIDDLTINENEKIGLLGDNGIGKTTFFRILLGLDKNYIGDIDTTRNMAHISNEIVDFSLEAYSKAMLGIGEKYSPGELQRLKLIELLTYEESFLLIDEPTSHLDFDQKEKLIDKLQNRLKGYMLISHDRDFINQTCNKIFELSNEKIEVYNGNYDFYLDEKVKRSKFVQREYDKYVSEKRRLENVASDMKKKSSKVRATPKRMGNSEARLHKMGGQGNRKKLDKQVKSIESRLDQLDIKEKPREESSIQLTIHEKDKIHSKVLIRAENLNKAYEDKIIFKEADFVIENNSKIAFLGKNGSGKTTLLKMIINEEGVWLHPNLRIGYYSQLEETIDDSKTILKNVLETSIYNQSMTRIILARLGFKSDDVFKKVNILSDGEKSKVKLTKLLTSNFNYLVFDEPTNYLDIRAIEALEELLVGYDRAFIFVTHDVSFINKVADSLMFIEDYKISNFKGSFEDYRNRKEKLRKKEDADEFLLDFKLSSINSRLTMDISKDERESLEVEYKKIMKIKNQGR